jgi:hypothetical protein
MKEFDPLHDVENNRLILDGGQWPSFHGAEVQDLSIWRGDVRPDDNVRTTSVIEASFELCALREPYIAVLKFHDCDAINLQGFNHQNAVYDLVFEYKARDSYSDETPLPRPIVVTFERAFGAALSFNCFRIEALQKIAVGATELQELLGALAPELVSGEFVFATVPDSRLGECMQLSPLASFREKEGVTLVLSRDSAEKAGFDCAQVFRCITLGVHSSLELVGLTAAVSSKLARGGISANVIAAYHHDHIFVPSVSAGDALAALQEFSFHRERR